MPFNVIHLSETDSTNQWLRRHDSSADTAVWADHQTAGRGCGQNTWESEPGANLLFSLLLHPTDVPAESQFIISMANALALSDALSHYAGDILIKWPNDIYWHDRKLCGTLIETTLQGRLIRTCIVGTGINVNQTCFRSDAPNPVSLCQILGREVSRDELLQRVLDCVEHRMLMVADGRWDDLRHSYRRRLYRLGQTHPYRFADGRTEPCRLEGVTDDGHLLLQADGRTDPYSMAFKEVQFII